MIIDADVYLEHYGTKGMKWGVRKQQAASAARATGRVAWAGTKAVGRGTKRAAIWSKQHPKEAAAIAIGTVLVANMLKNKMRGTTLRSLPRSPERVSGMRFTQSRLKKSMRFKMPRLTPKQKPKLSELTKLDTKSFKRVLNLPPTSAPKLNETTFRG